MVRFSHGVRKLFCDTELKRASETPAVTDYTPKHTQSEQRILLSSVGVMSKTKSVTHLAEIEYLARKTPGPATYTPKVERSKIGCKFGKDTPMKARVTKGPDVYTYADNAST